MKTLTSHLSIPIFYKVSEVKEFMMKMTIATLLLLTVLFPWSAFSISQDKVVHLFFMERNINNNIVQYDLCLTGNSDLRDSNPVTVYWILGSGEREELNPFEKKFAYGIVSEEKIGKNKVRVRLAALKDQEIIVEKVGDSFRAVVFIQGNESILQKVYIEFKRGSIPEVVYIDLIGRTIRKNITVKERICSAKSRNVCLASAF